MVPFPGVKIIEREAGLKNKLSFVLALVFRHSGIESSGKLRTQ